MARILTYDDIRITVLEQTKNPQEIIQHALNKCMHTDDQLHGSLTKKTVRYLVDAHHMSPLEQAGMTVVATNISRALLAQITRQRTFKFASSSQHYQDYRDYPFVIHPDSLYNDASINSIYEDTFDQCLEAYLALISFGVPTWEARMVLPEAITVNLQITMDANNLAKFLMTRLCKRNVEEMQCFSVKLHHLASRWFPELFNFIAPHCVMYGWCNQGHMQAPECKGKWGTTPRSARGYNG